MSDNPGCLGFLFRLRGPQPPAVTYPYTVRESMLTPAELSFYHVLRQAVGEDTIFCKPRIADVLKTPQAERGAFLRISQKHLDFVVCDSRTSRPVLAVELDDRSHQRSDRAERDAFVDKAMAAAGLPILRVPARRGYDVATLKEQMNAVVKAVRA